LRVFHPGPAKRQGKNSQCTRAGTTAQHDHDATPRWNVLAFLTTGAWRRGFAAHTLTRWRAGWFGLRVAGRTEYRAYGGRKTQTAVADFGLPLRSLHILYGMLEYRAIHNGSFACIRRCWHLSRLSGCV